MITVNINLMVNTAQEAIEAFKALQAAGITASVTTPEKGKRFRMTREQKAECDALPENKREEFRQSLMQAAGFASEETTETKEDDGRDVFA